MAIEANRIKTLKIQSYFMLAFLAVQYILGMFANLYVQFPIDKPESQLWTFTWSQFSTATHTIIGLLLLIGAVVFLVRSIRTKSKFWIITAIVGLLAMVIAVVCGSLFVSTQLAFFSYIMSLCFLIGAAAYGLTAYKASSIKS
jgi:peptidoglycan/LPS O-acetylase OafA/YrhL